MFNRILAPLDGSPLAESVLPHLISLAEAYHAQVILLQVLESPAGSSQELVDPLDWKMRKSEAEAYLDDVSKTLQRTGIKEIQTELLEGEPAQRIVEYIQANGVDLVVLSSHGKTGLSRWNVSSVVRKVVQRCNRSTMIVRAYKTTVLEDRNRVRYKRIMVPLDGSQRAEYALNTALTLTRFHEAKLMIGHVVAQPELPYQVSLASEDRDLLDHLFDRVKDVSTKYLDQLHARLSMEFEHIWCVNDDVAATLHTMVAEENVDLVVLCAHGHSGKAKWPYGSVTTSFIEYGTTPLLMVQDLEPNEVEPTAAERTAQESKGH